MALQHLEKASCDRLLLLGPLVWMDATLQIPQQPSAFSWLPLTRDLTKGPKHDFLGLFATNFPEAFCIKKALSTCRP